MDEVTNQTEVLVEGPLSEGESRTFTYRDSIGLMAEGFVFRREGKLYSYRNVCRHQPLPLDYGDGDFFTEQQEYLLCRNHAALFEPETGLCVEGPCAGARLYPLEARDEDGVIRITVPAAEEFELE